MALESVAPLPTPPQDSGVECELFLMREDVLTVSIGLHQHGNPPDWNTLADLNDMIRGLARASMAVAEKVITEQRSGELWADAAEGVGFAITMLSQLADGVARDLNASTREAQA